MPSTASRPRKTPSLPSAVTSACEKRSARPSKSPRSMRSAYVNTRSLMAKRASATSDMMRTLLSEGVDRFLPCGIEAGHLLHLGEPQHLLHVRPGSGRHRQALLVGLQPPGQREDDV